MNDYIFRGITQSGHRPSVAAYFEPRYNINANWQLYVGISGESIKFPNNAAAEIDFYGGVRPTFGPLALDFGYLVLLLPGRQCYGTGRCTASIRLRPAASERQRRPNPIASFYEVYAKVTYTLDRLGVWRDLLLFAELPEHRRLRRISVGHRQVSPRPRTWRSAGIGWYVSGEFGRQWLGTSDAFYGTRPARAFAAGNPTASRMPTTTPGTSASASPGRCSRSICATPTPT